MNIAQVNQIIVQTDIVVIGSNPEMADYDNPRGEIFGYCGYVIAEAPDGSRWVFEHSRTERLERDVLDRLESFVSKVQKHINQGGTLDVNRWRASRPAYGSEAYANGGWSQEDALLERMADEEGF